LEYRLLEKTELWVKPVVLSGADLDACARVAAEALGLKGNEVMVTDAMGDTLTLDILVPTIRAEQIVARKEMLLNLLKGVSGVQILEETEVHSDGVLGLISLEEQTGKEMLERSRAMGTEIAERIRKRSMVCSTGREVLAGQILDTNTPFLMDALELEGYQVTRGKTLNDHAGTISRAFRQAAEDAYGLLITTGGIGAEGKDQTLEALGSVDPQAMMPYILKFKKGEGRHHRDGVRIGVGVLEPTLIVCLPGPHDEVQLSWPILRNGLNEGWNKKNLAGALADVLRRKFLDRSGRNQAHSGNITHGG
jgi:molybdenum cofactor synthesis domain-containing protein